MRDFEVHFRKDKKPTGQEVYDMVKTTAGFYWHMERESTNFQTEQLKEEIRKNNKKTAVLIAVSTAVMGAIVVMAVTLNNQ